MFDLDRIGGPSAWNALVDEVRSAGAEAVRLYEAGVAKRTEHKQDRSPVTEADRAVEERLRRHMGTNFPSVGFFGEETGVAETDTGLRFIVDPIDGTRAFIRGIPTWSVLVALEADGEPVAGIAYFPVDDDMFVAVQGHGATHNGSRLQVSSVRPLSDATISHGGLHQFTDVSQEHLLARLARSTFTQRGFTDFDGYRKLVLGQVDAMVDPGIKTWDIAPASILVREAGGRFTSFDGEDTIYSENVIASNGLVHDDLLRLVAAPSPQS